LEIDEDGTSGRDDQIARVQVAMREAGRMQTADERTCCQQGVAVRPRAAPQQRPQILASEQLFHHHLIAVGELRESQWLGHCDARISQASQRAPLACGRRAPQRRLCPLTQWMRSRRETEVLDE
jgi:hypothetical protein